MITSVRRKFKISNFLTKVIVELCTQYLDFKLENLILRSIWKEEVENIQISREKNILRSLGLANEYTNFNKSENLPGIG